MTKKELKQQIERLQSQMEFADTELKKYSQQQIELKAMIDASNAQMKIGGEEVSTALDEVKELSTYNKIMRNELPDKLAWLYWQWINQKTIYWLNRYDFETDKYDKEEILNAIWIDIMYGKSIFNKKTNLAYTCVKLEGDKVWGVPAYEMLNDQNYYSKKNGKWGHPDMTGTVEMNRADCVIFTWRFGNVGNFVWYLMYGCLYLYSFLIAANNNSMNVNKLFLEVNDIDNFKKEAGIILDPFENLVPMLKDKSNKGTGSNVLGKTNHIIETSFNKETKIEQIILGTKFINETLHNEFGIPITSSKNQSLSADANLSASTSANIAAEHDRRIKTALKELGIEMKINEPEVIEPENENADKLGEGTAKTDGEKVEEGAK